ncbi:acyl-CoA dehydrogenase family protein, partial [Burkholderia stabilis]
MQGRPGTRQAGMERRLTPGSCETEIINPDLNIRFAWFGRAGAAHTLWARDGSGARGCAPAIPARCTSCAAEFARNRAAWRSIVAMAVFAAVAAFVLYVFPRESVSMSASLAASTPSPQPPSLRLLSADESADESADDAHATNDDARIAALLDRLAPELAADAARNDVDGRFPHENFARLHRAGLIAQVVPRQHGGAGATLAQASGIVAAVARADPATALVLTMTYLQH